MRTAAKSASRLGFRASLLAVVVFAAGLAAARVLPASRAGSFPALYVTFLANHTFALTLADGTQVGAAGAAIPAGAYQLYLNDASGAVMQFDLAGPGVSLVDNMSNAEELSASYVETFQPSSTYTYRDDFQTGTGATFSTSATVLPSSGSTTSSSGGGSAATSTLSSVVPRTVPRAANGVIAVTIHPSGTLALAYRGRSLTTLRAGRYSIAATDTSRNAGLWLQEGGKKPVAVSGVAFVGRRSHIVDLKRGTWAFYSTSAGPKTHFVVNA